MPVKRSVVAAVEVPVRADLAGLDQSDLGRQGRSRKVTRGPLELWRSSQPLQSYLFGSRRRVIEELIKSGPSRRIIMSVTQACETFKHKRLSERGAW